MNRDLLETCSPEVRQALQFIDDNTAQLDQHSPFHSPAFYALDHVESPKSIEYVKNYDLPEDPKTDIFEHLDRLGFFAKLYNKHVGGDWSEDEGLQFYRNTTRSRQMSKGNFPLTTYNSSGPIWFLSQDDPSSEVVKDAIEYFISNNPPEKTANYPIMVGELGLGVNALADIDTKRYKTDIQRISDWIADSVEELHDSAFSTEENISYILLALLRTPERSYAVEDRLVRHLVNKQSSDGSWKGDIALTGLAATALIYTGKGPKIPAVEAEIELNNERHLRKKSKPEFVSTVPSTRSDTRETQIHDRTEQLIEQADDVLRISTIRIDLLYEEIIDRIDETDDLDVRIITSSGSPSGSRSKLKKAAMNELVKRTDGNVKEDELVHSRMVIADKDAVLVSSADLTREQLYEEFNAGIFTRDSNTVASATDFFDKVWDEAEHREMK